MAISGVAESHTVGSRRAWRGIALAIVLVLVLGAILVLQPFISSLAWAAVLTITVWPVYRRLVWGLGGRSTLAAVVLCLLIAAVLVVPLVLAVFNLSGDLAQLGSAWRDATRAGVPAAPEWVVRLPVVGPRAAHAWDRVGGDCVTVVSSVLSPLSTSPSTMESTDPVAPVESRSVTSPTMTQTIRWLQASLLAITVAIGQGTLQITMSLLFTLFLLKDGQAIVARMYTLAERVSPERGVQLVEVAGSTIRGVVYGILGTALVQGVLASIGFLIAGVPGAVLLGLLTFVLSPLPVGPPLVWIPASLWLFANGRPAMGAFLLVWGMIVSSVDNVIKPLIISRGSHVPFLLILIGVLGGAIAFGLIGVFLGPTLLAVVYRLVEAWSRSTDSPATPTTESGH